MNVKVLPIAACCWIGGVGCTPTLQTSLTAKDPAAKVPAIKAAADEGDYAAVGPMINGLESTDPAIRLFSAEGLRRLTGVTLGYEAYADEPARKAAVERWRLWEGNVQARRK